MTLAQLISRFVTAGILVLAGTQTLTAQSTPDSATAARVLADVAYLADDAREGRGVGTAGLDSAAAYVAAQFAKAGLRPAGTDGYFQPFVIDSTAPGAAHAGLGGKAVKNVVGLLPGRGALAGQVVVLGAHYDHLGLGGPGSLDPDSVGVVHNGADDNASGTAALLEAARIIAAREEQHHRTFVFVAFTAEELGTIGSSYYVRNPARANRATYAMINFDMVGRLRNDSLLVIGTGSAEEFSGLLDSLNADHGFSLTKTEDPWGPSDQTSFYGDKIPVVHFFTNTHTDYHRTTDDWDKINAEGVVRIASFAADFAFALAMRRNQLAFVDVPRPPPPTRGGGYGAYLGTIPDMSGSPGGVRLTGVRAGSPAEKAGIASGDIIVQIGDHEVKNLYHMTDALRAHKPGDVVKVVVLRGDERLELTATLGRRGG